MDSKKHRKRRDSTSSSAFSSSSESSRKSISNSADSASSDSEGSKYEVEYICGKKFFKNQNHYLVKWRELSKKDNTWEKNSNLKVVQDKVYEFEEKTSKLLFKKHLMLKTESSLKKTKKPSKEKLNMSKEKHNKKSQHVPKHNHNKTIKINKNEKIYGSFDIDEPKEITNHRIGPDYESEGSNCVYFKVEWDQSSKIRKPLGSYFSMKELKKRAPAILLEYFINNAVLLNKEAKRKENTNEECLETSESNFRE